LTLSGSARVDKGSDKETYESAIDKADTWTRRYRQQNFQAWASPLGKTYDPVGKTEMHTPKLIRRSLALELDDEIATEADYEPSIELPASAKSRKRREKTSSLIQSEIRSGKNEQHLLSEHLSCFRQQVKSPVRCGSSCMEQLSRVADTNSSVKANTRWRKGMNTVGLFNFRGRRHNRPFTTTSQLISTAKCKNDTELVSYKIQLRKGKELQNKKKHFYLRKFVISRRYS